LKSGQILKHFFVTIFLRVEKKNARLQTGGCALHFHWDNTYIAMVGQVSKRALTLYELYANVRSFAYRY